MSSQSLPGWFPNSFPGLPAGPEQKLVMTFRRTIKLIQSVQGDVHALMNPVTPKGAVVSSNIVVIEDTRANVNLYPADKYPLGSLLFFTDWNVTYINRLALGAQAWQYLTGELNVALASFPTLGANDAGLLLQETTYQHRYRWTGTIYQFAPGDEGSGKYVPTIGAAPTGGVWHLADGTAGVKLSVGDGTTTTVTVKNLNAKRLIGADAAYAEVAGAAPTFQAGAKTDDESAHTHDLANHTHITTVTGTTAGAGANPVGQTANFTSSGPTPNTSGAGSAHHHNISGANAPLNIPTDGNGGIADHTWMVWWVRQ